MTTFRLLPGNGHAHGVTGAMLAVMAACPPAPPEPRPDHDRPAPNRQTTMHSARHAVHSTVSSPLGQVRAMAWLMGLRPTLACCTCSRIASGVASRLSFYDAQAWLLAAGFDPDTAEHVAGLVWPEKSGGGVGEGADVTRGGPRRRPEDAGLGAAGSSPV